MPKKKNKKTSKKDEFEITSIEEVDSWDELSEGDELSEEGQLAVDVYQDKNSIIIKSTVAGVEPDDIDITFDNDMITIRGKRRRDVTVDEDNYFYQGCLWFWEICYGAQYCEEF